MFSARRRRARATPAAAIPRRPKPQPPSFRLPAEVSPPGLGGGSRRPGLPSQPAWAAGEGGVCGVVVVGGRLALLSAQNGRRLGGG